MRVLCDAKDFWRNNLDDSTNHPYRSRSQKHPLSVHVWAGISKNGTTDIAIFTGVMDSSGYQTIMKEYLLPFISRAYPHGHRLVMDNDPKHRSKSTSEWMKESDDSHTLPPKPPKKGLLRNANSLFYEETKIRSMKICYKVSLY